MGVVRRPMITPGAAVCSRALSQRTDSYTIAFPVFSTVFVIFIVFINKNS
jgi:hypothetical protein